MEHIIVSFLVVVVLLYAWGGIGFLFFRFYRAETESRMRNFMEYHRTLFRGRKLAGDEREVTKKTIRSYGHKGWNMASLPFIGLVVSDHWSHGIVLTSIGVLFFGGLMFAHSWYGLRCLRMLGLESIKGPFEESKQPFKTRGMVLAQNKKLFAISALVVALAIFGGYFYITTRFSAPVPLWMLLLDFVLYALFLYALWRMLLRKG